jgi:hypothetical protein
VPTRAITKRDATETVPSKKELVALVKRAEEGDRDAFGELAAFVGNQSPFWNAMGDLESGA